MIRKRSLVWGSVLVGRWGEGEGFCVHSEEGMGLGHSPGVSGKSILKAEGEQAGVRLSAVRASKVE